MTQGEADSVRQIVRDEVYNELRRIDHQNEDSDRWDTAGVIANAVLRMLERVAGPFTLNRP